jgi:hypothetical protein
MMVCGLFIAAVTPSFAPSIDEPAARQTKLGATIKRASLTALRPISLILPPLHDRRFLKNVDKFVIAASNLYYGGLPRNFLGSQVHERVLEDRTAHGKSDETRHCGGGRQPIMHFHIVFTATQNDAPDLFTTVPSRRFYNLFAA